MTPEREQYFTKCSKWEKILRHWIKVRKHDIKRHKFALNNAEAVGEPKNLFRLNEIRFHKDHLKCFRHELARLKGMDRVVRVREKDTYLDCYGSDCFECECENEVELGYYKHCPWCGRKILWEQVK